MRKYLEKTEDSGDYDWDKMDGYNDGGKGSLDDHPDMQEKVRRVVTQGFIDPEDWKGVCIPHYFLFLPLSAHPKLNRN